MISIPLLKETMREHIRKAAMVTGVLILYLLFVIVTYQEDGKASILELFSTFPPILQTTFGISGYGTSLAAVLGGCFQENIIVLIPFFFVIPTLSAMISEKIENKEMVWILLSPTSRRKVLFTQIISFAALLFLMFFFMAFFGILCMTATGLSLASLELIKISFGAFCLHFCFGAIGCVISVLCDEKAMMVVTTTAVLLIFYLLKMLAALGGKWIYLKFLTICSLYQAVDILEGNFIFFWKDLLLLLLGAGGYVVAIALFEKRELSL